MYNLKFTCEVLVVAGLEEGEDSLRVEETELRELLLPSAPNEFCTSLSCCGCGWSLGGKGKLDLTTLCSGANRPKLGSHWKYLKKTEDQLVRSTTTLVYNTLYIIYLKISIFSLANRRSFRHLLAYLVLVFSTECTIGMVEGDLKWSAAMELWS